MAGPIVRSGRVILGVELQAAKLNASPVTDALVASQKKAAGATRGVAVAAEEYSTSLGAQAAAEAKVEALEEQRLASLPLIAQEQRTQAKLAQALAEAVNAEAASVANAGAVSAAAAAKTHALDAANVKLAQSYQKAALGGLQVVRGMALLGGSENENIAVALKHVFVIQGLIDISSGLIKVQKNLAAAYKAQAAAAGVAAVSTAGAAAAGKALVVALLPIAEAAAAIYLVVEAIDYFVETESEATAAAEAHQKVIQQSVELYKVANEKIEIVASAELKRAGYMRKLEDREAALTKLAAGRAAAQAHADSVLRAVGRDHLAPEFNQEALRGAAVELQNQIDIQEALLDTNREKADAAKDEIDSQIKLIELRERELTQAKDALRLEEEKQRSLRASIGLLTPADQRKLESAIAAVQAGTATPKQLRDVQAFGGVPGEAIATTLAEPLGKALADTLEKLAMRITGEASPSIAALEAKHAAEEREMAATGGKTAESALREFQEARDKVEREAADTADAIYTVLRGLSHKLEKLEIEIAFQKQAQIQKGL